ncbi:polyisoprenoid-binding protein [Leucobacter sp. OH2974_COT-288]|uniref:Polyisoprenoid-binding protein YceI n=1 Tax=Canibacter oris TaxID=1365628 RepID=A0A840DGS9_9MICO|nr:YceI family protein [Canibacter oris]MBB4071940.1 polyisoprenoid-binding protein YceI [Canibacter oris]RRD36087.1 polyisoprenoid-binding protein [Leucobacter sp. OH2974_COT-288]
MTVSAEQIPGYEAATWNIDPVHSEVSFTVRHMGISKVKGNFADFSGTIVTAANPVDSTVEATVQVASVSTNNKDRDQHLQTSDFFAADEFPTFEFKSQNIEFQSPQEAKITGELTMRGVTKEVTFDAELGAFGEDAYGQQRLGLSAKTTVERSDFGIEFNAAVEKTGNLVVSNKVVIELELSAVKAA